ncbi:MAG: DNA/RNA nuclease SfsA [Anaerolineae bacterium]
MSPEVPRLDFPTLIPAFFVRRDNRFRTQVSLKGEEIAAYLPNPGRLEELLEPGRKVLLRPAPASSRSSRRTGYDLLLIEAGDVWVSLDSRLPNPLMERMLRGGWFSAFEAYPEIQREVRLGRSVIDFRLDGAEPSSTLPSEQPCWIEVKSVTLVEEEGTAAFPDAPTKRGRRHVRELQAAVREGARAAVVFVVQREDAARFAPHDATDPEFGEALREAVAAGVETYAVRCRVTPEGIWPLDTLPVVLR